MIPSQKQCAFHEKKFTRRTSKDKKNLQLFVFLAPQAPGGKVIEI